MTGGDKKNSDIYGMSYNSARDELFLTDANNKVVRAMRVRDNAGDLRDQSPTRHVTIRVECVPHERLGHTARVFGRRRAGQRVGQLAGGTEPQRQRVARGAARGNRKIWMDLLRS